ncbi:uncharacterized protein RBU33_021823 isoform 2-T2 [Hipposideros larvatus]
MAADGRMSARRCCQRRARDTSLPPPRRTCRRAAPERNSHLHTQRSPVRTPVVFQSSTAACASLSSIWMASFTSMWLSAQFAMKLRSFSSGTTWDILLHRLYLRISPGAVAKGGKGYTQSSLIQLISRTPTCNKLSKPS